MYWANKFAVSKTTGFGNNRSLEGVFGITL